MGCESESNASRNNISLQKTSSKGRKQSLHVYKSWRSNNLPTDHNEVSSMAKLCMSNLKHGVTKWCWRDKGIDRLQWYWQQTLKLELDWCISIPIWWCCWCIVLAKFCQYISAIAVHKSVTLLLCLKCSETQVATLSITLTD